MSRKSRWFLCIFFTIIIVILCRIFLDKREYNKINPQPLEIGNVERGSFEGVKLISFEEIQELNKLKVARKVIQTECFQNYLIQGYSDDINNIFVSRNREQTAFYERMIELLEEKPGFDSSKYGSAMTDQVLNELLEYQLLRNIEASIELNQQSSTNYNDLAINNWILPLKYMHISMRGSGLYGRLMASQIAHTLLLETSMASEEHQFTYDEVKKFNAEIRKYLEAPEPLEMAFRDDLTAFIGATKVMYGEVPDNAQEKLVYTGESIDLLTQFYIWVLGASSELTTRNIEFVFSYLIVNSRNPYSLNGIVKDLPKWSYGEDCLIGGVDPIGHAIIEAYLPQAVTSSAIQCHYETELRVAMVGFALNAYKHVNKVYPNSLDELLAEGLILEEDLVDPFSKKREGKLKYKLDGNSFSWLIYSVGVNQEDNGGTLATIDANPENQNEFQETDLIFKSGERSRRIREAMKAK